VRRVASGRGGVRMRAANTGIGAAWCWCWSFGELHIRLRLTRKWIGGRSLSEVKSSLEVASELLARSKGIGSSKDTPRDETNGLLTSVFSKRNQDSARTRGGLEKGREEPEYQETPRRPGAKSR